jgi:hypothetical protein
VRSTRSLRIVEAAPTVQPIPLSELACVPIATKEWAMAVRRRKRWKTVLPTVTLTVFPFTVNMQTAQAFFPPLVPPPPVVVVVPPVLPPVTPPVIVVPPVIPPPFVPPVVPPVVVPPVCDCDTDPNCVPEPATLGLAALGLAAVAGYRRLRGKDEKESAQS